MSSAAFTAVLALVFIVALATVRVICRWRHDPNPPSRYAALDGLRGFAATAVFTHHAALWLTVARGGPWQVPFEPRMAAIVGPTAVSLFFMVTAFLFVDKVVLQTRPTDWLRLFVSRLLRMTPLFLAVFAVVLTIVAIKTGAPREPFGQLLRNVLHWLPLSVLGLPDINRLPNSWMIVAGATWTLKYETLFYLALPMVALCGRKAPSAKVLALGSGLFFSMMWWTVVRTWPEQKPVMNMLLAFPAGALAAFANRSRQWVVFATSMGGSACAWAFLGALLYLPLRHGWPWTVVAAQGFFFALVCAGNSLGGLLTAPSARQFGHISYSIYLWHGPLLYLVVGEWVGIDAVATGSDAAFWALVVALVPVLVGLSYATYRLIELPALARTDRWTSAIRSCWPSERSLATRAPPGG